jgi:hypothetical protein
VVVRKMSASVGVLFQAAQSAVSLAACRPC